MTCTQCLAIANILFFFFLIITFLYTVQKTPEPAKRGLQTRSELPEICVGTQDSGLK